jgi:hypothetical protein
MVSVLASSAEIVGLSPVRVKAKTIKLIFVASSLSTQHSINYYFQIIKSGYSHFKCRYSE